MAFKLIIVFLLILIAIVTSKKTNIPRRHAIKTIRVKDGDIVDCVDIYKQPAFDHPLLVNHIVQMKSSHLDQMKYTSKTLQNSSSSKAPSQPWLQYGRCPNGTIPILALTAGYNYSGARANIKVWNPYVDGVNDTEMRLHLDYSSSQVMLRACPVEHYDIVKETVEAGWMASFTFITAMYKTFFKVVLFGPLVYKDFKTRLFVYWKADNGSSCFDLICPGFVQTSSEVLLGGDIGTYNYGSEIEFQISKDPDTNNWWFLYNSEEVGYWPSDIFQSMKYEANMVQWGGEVFSPYVGTHPHTDTAMGNGKFADRLYRKSGTMTGLLIEENSSPLKRPESYTISSNEWNCYDADLLDEKVPEPVFLYGGPGSHFNPNC
uniref:Neprosin PEP catalytic domain-containing protein n=2 Tax=Helianthus annuus TaxID=4232 RepID=A0A251TJJ1_HELAN